MTKTIAAAAAFSFFGLAVSGQTANAQSFQHIDNLALSLARQTRVLEREFASHFRHTREYRHLASDASKMAAFADHIHEVAHHGGDILHLQSDMQKIDRLFHHIEELVYDIEHDVIFGHGGHFHGNVNHVRRQMRVVSNTLHHLKADIDRVARYGGARPATPVGPRPPVVRRPGFYVNLGGFRIRIGR